VEVERRYGALRAISTILIVIGWVCLVFGFLGAGAVFVLGLTNVMEEQVGPLAALGGVGGAAAILAYALVLFLAFVGYGQLIRLLIDVEENTRKAALILSSRQAP
jgi:amino acid transporter